jgi:hypothetical protein
MKVTRIAVATDGAGAATSTIVAHGQRFYGWYVDINGLATSTTTDFTFTDETGRTLDSAVNVTADGMYLAQDADTGGGAWTDYPPIVGTLTLTVAQGGATITDGVIWVYTLE